MRAGIAARVAWMGVLGAVYIAFWIWYGGNAPPLSSAEAASLLNQIEASRLVTQSDRSLEFRRNVEALVADDDGREFVMVNLETMKRGATAEAADQAYARAVVPALLKRGSFPIYLGRRNGLLLGSREAAVDRVGLVRYRSLRDLLLMNLDPRMAKGVPHKFASLDHTEVFPTKPIISAAQVRLTVGVLLVGVAVVGLRGLDWWAGRGRRQHQSKKEAKNVP